LKNLNDAVYCEIDIYKCFYFTTYYVKSMPYTIAISTRYRTTENDRGHGQTPAGLG